MVYSRLGRGAPLAQAPQEAVATPEAARIRDDGSAPVMTFQTETDLTLLGYAAARQPDTDRFRLWEVAGTAHADYYSTVSGRTDATGEPRFAAVSLNGLHCELKCDHCKMRMLADLSQTM